MAFLADGVSALPSARALARATRAAFLSDFDSGAYLAANLKTWAAFCLSKVWENWLMEGGTFNRCWSTCRCLWSLMYAGHRTNRVRSRFG